ncbi:hypothetical protein LBMAG49_04100 [Planctomycetota bacterium]|nr:hypothetical protein LBMAG49_04100 [Planctomycetota bacterium]
MATIRRVPHDWQNPRPLHENATTRSFLHAAQCTQRKAVAEDPATQVSLHLAAAKPRLYPFASFGSLHKRGSTPPARSKTAPPPPARAAADLHTMAPCRGCAPDHTAVPWNPDFLVSA